MLCLSCTQDGKINIVWNETVGVWVSPIGHATAKQIAEEMCHMVQIYTSHNRKNMAKPKKWESTIREFTVRYHLEEVSDGVGRSED